jgi:hypothetical protein
LRPITVTVGPVGTTSATNIAASQTPGAAGALTLSGALVSGGVATLPTPQRVLITTTDTTTKFTITGTTPTGSAVSETVVGGGSNVTSTLDYATVTSIRVNQGTTAAVTVGTSGVASTPWVRFDEWAAAQIAIQCDVTGTVNYTVQSTLDDPNSVSNLVIPSAVVWVSTSDTAAVGATGTVQTNFAYCPVFGRVLLNSGSGSVTATFTQSGVVPY